MVSNLSFSQSNLNSFLTPSDTLNIPRKNVVIISEASLAGITLIGLNQLWYAKYDKSKFHTINDNNEWMQMDKFGHIFSSYAANATGTGLYIGQELLWKEQRITIKYSFHQTRYAAISPDKLGGSLTEQLLKDYNGQTYWLSANLHSFFQDSKIPKWLNIAFGYGAYGMLTGVKVIDNQVLTSNDRYRQFYLSFDVNLNRIKTKSHILKTIFSVFSIIKVPFPTLEFSKNRYVFHLLYY